MKSERKWEIESDLNSIIMAHKIKSDKKRLARVIDYFNKQRQAIEAIEGKNNGKK